MGAHDAHDTDAGLGYNHGCLNGTEGVNLEATEADLLDIGLVGALAGPATASSSHTG